MRLLLTRAEADAARTRAKLEAAGHTVLLSPVIEMRATGAAWPGGVVDAVLATSAQAFTHLSCGPLPEARHLMPLFLVGDRTKRVAREAGFRGTAVVTATAAALASTMTLSRVAPRQLVYLAGVDRKTDLEDGLRNNGFSPTIVEVYEAVGVSALTDEAIKRLAARSIDGILHFSRRSAGLFVNLVESANLEASALNHFCLSDDAAIPLKAAGCGNLHIARAPTEAALLALIVGG